MRCDRLARLLWPAALAVVVVLASCAPPAQPPTGGAGTPSAVETPMRGGAIAMGTPALVPTMTPPPTDTDDVSLPASPPASDELGAALNAYLSGGGSPAGLEARLREWGAITAENGGVYTTADLDGDGREDIVVAMADPAPAGDLPPLLPPGSLFVFLRGQGGTRLAHVLHTEPPAGMPTVLALQDLTGDGADDLLYVTTECGAHTCYDALTGFRWADGEPQTLFAEPISEPYPEYSLTDRDGDHTYEILVDVGTIGSVGAGPQRTYRRVYSWDGARYALTDEQLTSAEHPIHVLNDADELLGEGHFAPAVALYERSYADPALDRSWPGPDGWEVALEAYARYRVVLAHALAGETEIGHAAYEALQAAVARAPQAEPFVDYARFFWEEYGRSGDVEDACAAVLEVVNAGEWRAGEFLNAFGYANRAYAPEDMCPAAQTR